MANVSVTITINDAAVDSAVRRAVSVHSTRVLDGVIREANALLASRKKSRTRRHNNPPVRESWEKGPLEGSSASGFTRELRNTAPHANWAENGFDLGGQIITPVSAKFLKIHDSAGGVYFARSVRGGSFEGHHFLRDAIRSAGS